MSSSTRLRPVVSHAESLESQRHQELLDASMHLREAELQLAQLQEYRLGYTSDSAGSGDASLGSVGWRDRHVFLSRLNDAVIQQQQRVTEQKILVEGFRQSWIDSRVRTQSLQKLVDKRVQRERTVANRREQNAVDEANCSVAARRTNQKGHA